MWHSPLTSLDIITPLCMLRTIQYWHRCLKTKDPLCHLGNEWRHTFQTFHTFHWGWKLWWYSWFTTTHVTLQKSFFAVYTLYRIDRTLQNPTSAVFTIMLHVHVAKSFCRSLTFLWCTLHNLSFAGFELQGRQNRDGLPSPVHFFDQQTCIW